MTSPGNEIADLQIYITRSPGPIPEAFRQFPPIYTSDEATYVTRDIASDTRSIPQFTLVNGDRPKYIAIANSSVIQELTLPFSPDEIGTILRGLESGKVSLHDLVSFGSTLFNFLFTGAIRDLYRSLISSTEGKVRITVASPLPELVILPWELMCDAHLDYFPRFLSNQSNVLVNRSLRMFNRSVVQAENLADDELRILLVTANPIDTAMLDLRMEEHLLTFSINQPPSISNNVHVKTLHDADINQLDDTITNFNPHVLHFAGHGGYDRDSQLGFIILCSQDGRKRPDFVNCFRFSDILRRSKSIKLVVLNNCFGAHQGLAFALSGVAQSLNASDIPAVVSMQFAISDTTAHAIVLNFYRLLLREKMAVEECVANIRRYLFINGYHPSESFGVAFFQNNRSFTWEESTPLTTRRMTFSEYMDIFERDASNEQTTSLKDEIDKIKALANRTKALSTSDFLLANRIFDDLEGALDILQRVSDAKVKIDTFLKVCLAVQKLSHTLVEKNLVRTSIIILPRQQVTNDKFPVTQELKPDFFLKEPHMIADNATRVDGKARSFLVKSGESDSRRSDFHTSIVSLEAMISDQQLAICNPEWIKLCAATRESGCAFALPGDARVKLLVKGEQIAEYRQAVWKDYNLAKLWRDARAAIDEGALPSGVLQSILKVCAVASDFGKGLTLIVQTKDEGVDVLAKCSAGYIRTDTNASYAELQVKPIQQFTPADFLNAVAGDNAVILGSDGHTIALNAHLIVSKKGGVNPVPGTHARHLSAQLFSFETKTSAFVVSVDGPITVFQDGGVVARMA
jgi:hypothetical protein